MPGGCRRIRYIHVLKGPADKRPKTRVIPRVLSGRPANDWSRCRRRNGFANGFRIGKNTYEMVMISSAVKKGTNTLLATFDSTRNR